MICLTDRQQEVLDLYRQLNHSEQAVALKLGIGKTAVRKSLFFIAKKGHYIAPDTFCEQAPVGFGLTKSTIQINSKGEVVQKWDRVSPIKHDLDIFIDSLAARVTPMVTKIDPPEQASVQDQVALVWPVIDMHIGLAAWKPETLDSNFDLNTSKLLEDAANKEMFKKVGCVAHTHLAFLGDNTHSDNRSNQTEKSGNTLDVDSRYPKIVWACQDIICNKIDMALAHSRTVSVDILPGNHDPNTAVCMMAIIGAYYRSEPRVTIKIDPTPFKFFQWGISMTMGCHGHEAPPQRLAAYLMDYVIQHEIRAKELYVFKGHVHHRKTELIPGVTESDGGVMVETFPTLTAKDSWHASKAYSSRRATIGKIFHKQFGLIDDCKVNAKQLMSSHAIG